MTNAAVRAFADMFAALEAGEDPARFVTDDVLGEDRRLGFQSSGKGVKSFLKNMREVEGVGVRLDSFEVIATRGERHALVHGTYVSANEFAVDVLVRLSLEPGGLITSYAVFDPHDISAARQDLDSHEVGT